jgi:hypothetical protein
VRVTADDNGVDLGQGAQTVIMQRDFRLEAIQSIDVTIGKVFNVGGDFQIKVLGTIFNLLNTGNDLVLATQRFDVDEEPIFVPTQWAKPRRLGLQVGMQF